MDVVAHRSVSGQQYAGVAKSVLHIPYIYATCTSHDYIICIFYTAKYIQYAWNIIRNCVYKASTVNILVFIAVLALYLPEFLGLRFFVSRQATFQDLDLSGPWSVDLASWIRKKTKRPKGPMPFYRSPTWGFRAVGRHSTRSKNDLYSKSFYISVITANQSLQNAVEKRPLYRRTFCVDGS